MWIIARERLPQAANDNLPTQAGLHVDRSRKDRRARGKNVDPRSLDPYIALPSAKPRLSDAEPKPALTGNWDGASRGVVIKPQRQKGDFPLYPFGRFTKFRPAIAIGGLGQPKQGKHRGDVRLVAGAVLVKPPSEIDTVIEVILSGGNVADVGKAFGAKGGHADRRGGAELLAAGRWAMQAVANDNGRTFVTSAAASSG